MLKLFNTLSRKVEEFKPLHPPKVGFYGCGPTVYDRAHLGNLRAYIFDDVLRRALIHSGYKVQFVMNITDVGHLTSDADEGEDKLEKGAKRDKLSVWDVAAKYTALFKQDLAMLNIAEPDQWLKATDNIPEQIALIQKLEAKGFTYRISDGIYYDTSKFPNYGKLARLNLEGQKEGARVEANKEKRNPTDFALWKFSPKGDKRQMEWESPWGVGFPGWHVECSAMSMKALGETFDIHTGGVDHIPVHHTNEIAQSEGVTGKQFVKYWVHNEFLVLDPFQGNKFINNVHICPNGHKNIVKDNSGYKRQKVDDGFVLMVVCSSCGVKFSGGIKMSKSSGTFFTLDTIREKNFNPLAYRYFCLGAHYRSKLNFSWEALRGAQKALDDLLGRVVRMSEPAKIGCAEFEQKFFDAMNNDLNTPQALAVVWGLLKSDYPDEAKKASLFKMDEILGLGFASTKPKNFIIPNEIKDIARKRKAARKRGDYKSADELRSVSAQKGYIIEDTPKGQNIRPEW